MTNVRLFLTAAVVQIMCGCSSLANRVQKPFGGEFEIRHKQQARTDQKNIADCFTTLLPDTGTYDSFKTVPSIRNFEPRYVFKYKNRTLYIDSLPNKPQRNLADNAIFKAENKLKKSEALKTKIWLLPAVYLGITAIPAFVFYQWWYREYRNTFGDYTVESVLLSYALYALMAVVTVLWIGVATILYFLPTFKRQKAIRILKKSPQYAPIDRRIEYEVRVLLMMSGYLTYKGYYKEIGRIKALLSTYPTDDKWKSMLQTLEKGPPKI